MIVAALGQTPRLVGRDDPAGLFLNSIQTMTAAMVQIGTGDIVGRRRVQEPSSRSG